MSRISRRWIPALVASSALALGLVAVATPASAAPIGTFTLAPTSGTFFTAIQGTTSAGCPTGTTSFVVRMSGGSISPVQNINGAATLASVGAEAGGSAFSVTFSKVLDTVAADNGASLTNGSYLIELVCRQGSSSIGEFTSNITIAGTVGSQTWAVASSTPVPTLATAPTISGSSRVGSTITCGTGTWNDATSINVEFLKNNVVAQASTTDRDIVLAAADLGKSVRCRVSGVGPGGTGTPALTSTVTVTAGAAAVATAKPKILGKAKVGKTLKAFRGTWAPSASYAYSYVWKRGAKVVKQGATATAYKLTKKDKKKKITLTVVVKRAGYATASASSAAVKVK